MPELTVGQYQTVVNVLSLAIASMTAGFAFFVLVRNEVAPRYRGSILASAVVVLVAGYHYYRIFNSWEASYHLNDHGGYSPTGEPFNLAYRYVDWVITVPLLLTELVLVLGLPKKEVGGLLGSMIIAAFLMIALGYVGELDKTSTSVMSNRGLWGFLSSIPFAYILVVLLARVRTAIGSSSPQVGVLLRNAGLLTLFTWGFYPIAYMAPFFGLTGGTAETYLQVGYSLADIAAKVGYGILIYNIASLRTEEEKTAPAHPEAAGFPVRVGA